MNDSRAPTSSHPGVTGSGPGSAADNVDPNRRGDNITAHQATTGSEQLSSAGDSTTRSSDEGAAREAMTEREGLSSTTHPTTGSYDNGATQESITGHEKSSAGRDSSATKSSEKANDDPTRVLQRDPPLVGDGYVNVPVPVSYEDLDQEPSGATKTKDKIFGGLKKLRGDKDTAAGQVKVLQVSKEDYARYFARNDDGNYIGTEPEGEGKKRFADELKDA